MIADSTAQERREAKAFATTRARLAIIGVHAFRTDPSDGTVRYVSVAAGTVRLHPDVRGLRALADLLEAGGGH
jgi:hypothetical protein